MIEVDEMMELGLALVGSVDTVRRQLDRMRDRLPVNWLFAWMYNGVIDNATLMKTIEHFARDVAALPG
jgi:hypothetical protein